MKVRFEITFVPKQSSAQARSTAVDLVYSEVLSTTNLDATLYGKRLAWVVKAEVADEQEAESIRKAASREANRYAMCEIRVLPGHRRPARQSA